MAKAQKKKTINEPISISKIYETIKARDFLQELWWDLISDIKEKPTYKRIKEMVSSLINDTIKDFSTEPCSDAERLKRRTMLTEISIMTYTVDTVISEVLFRKLQNEFQLIIANMIEEIQAEHTASKSTEAGQPNSMLENIQNIFADASKNETDGRVKNTKVSPRMKTSPLSSQPSPEIPNISSRRGRRRKLNPVPKTRSVVPKSSTPSSRKKVPPVLSPKKGLANAAAEKKLLVSSKSVSGNNETRTSSVSKTHFVNGIKTEIDDIYPESDAESVASDGNLSMTSVSSVHTSELSSFEDTISIDGDEESGQKKQIPLKVANDMYLQGTLSQIYEFGKRTEMQKMSLLSSNPSRSKSPKHIASPSSLSRKVLPQRVRKPNSKYNSESIICEAYPTSPSSFSPKVNPDASPQPRQKRRKTTSTDDRSEKSTSANSSPVRSHSNSISRNSHSTKASSTVNHMSPSTSSTKRYNASDLYKPRSAIGSSRGTSAFTLFTTMNR